MAQDEIIDFGPERRRHERFFGRVDLLAQLSAYEGQPWILVLGRPGQGKSALLSRYVEERKQAGVLVVYHVLRRDMRWAKPEIVASSLAAQLEILFPQAQKNGGATDRRLVELLARVEPQLAGRRLVVVVDGLDEVDTGASGNPLAFFLPEFVPSGVTILCAARHGFAPLSLLYQKPPIVLDLDETAASNHDSCRQFWAEVGPELGLSRLFIEQATEAAEGLPLHANTLYKDLLQTPPKKRRVARLPRGLDALLSEIWDGWPEAVQQVVALLCVAREALPQHVIVRLAGWTEQKQAKALQAAVAFLIQDKAPWDGDQDTWMYRPSHLAVTEFVVQQLQRGLGVAGEHQRLVDGLARWPSTGGSESERLYTLHHGLMHRIGAKSWQSLERLATDMSFLIAKTLTVGPHALEQDLIHVATAWPDSDGKQSWRALERAIRGESHHLRERPTALPELLFNRLRYQGWQPQPIRNFLGLLPHVPRLQVRHPPLGLEYCERVFSGEAYDCRALLVSPDGKWLIATHNVRSGRPGEQGPERDIQIKVWDLATGKEEFAFNELTAPVRVLAWAPGENGFLSGNSLGELQGWSLETKQKVEISIGRAEGVCGLQLTEQDCMVVTFDYRRTARPVIRIIASDKPEENTDEIPYETLVQGIALNEAGMVIGARTALPGELLANAAGVWMWSRQERVVQLRGVGLPYCQRVALMHDGETALLLSAQDKNSSSYMLSLLDLRSDHLIKIGTGTDYTGDIRYLLTTSDGKRAVVGLFNSLHVWDLEQHKQVGEFFDPTADFSALTLFPDGNKLVSVSDGVIKVWDLLSLTRRSSSLANEPVTSWTFMPSEQCLLAALKKPRHNSLEVIRIDLESGARSELLIDTYTYPVCGEETEVRALLPDEQGTVLVAATDDALHAWNLQSGICLWSSHAKINFRMRPLLIPGTRRFLAPSKGDTLALWDFDSGHRAELLPHGDLITAMAILPDGRTAISASWLELKRWPLDEALKTADAMQAAIRATRAGDVINCANYARIQEPGTDLIVQADEGTGFSFLIPLPDRKRLLLGSSELGVRHFDRLQCLDLSTPHGQAEKYAFPDVASALALTSSGTHFLTGGWKTLRLWSVQDGACLETFWGTASFNSVACKGHLVCAGDEAGNLWVFDFASPTSQRGVDAMPVSCFLASDPRDQSYVHELVQHLTPLRDSGLLTWWAEYMADLGINRHRELEQKLDAAAIIVLLVSPNFVESDSCMRIAQRAMERHAKEKVVVLPIIIRAVFWDVAVFGNQRSLPRAGKPIASYAHRDEAWSEVALELRRLVLPEDAAVAQSSSADREFDASLPVGDRPVDFVLITALEEERDAVLGLLPGYRKLDKDARDVYTYYEASLRTTRGDGATYRIIVTSLTGMGPLNAVSKALAVVQRWQPWHVLLVGIAGGVRGKVELGDVLVASQIVDYTLGKMEDRGGTTQREVRWEVYQVDANLLDAASNFSKGWEPRIQHKRPKEGFPRRHLGVIASGGDVIAVQDRMDQYQGIWTKLIGVEMEGGGVASALHQTVEKPSFLMIRGVSDLANQAKKARGTKVWRAYACEAAAAYTIALLESGPTPARAVIPTK